VTAGGATSPGIAGLREDEVFGAAPAEASAVARSQVRLPRRRRAATSATTAWSSSYSAIPGPIFMICGNQRKPAASVASRAAAAWSSIPGPGLVHHDSRLGLDEVAQRRRLGDEARDLGVLEMQAGRDDAEAPAAQDGEALEDGEGADRLVSTDSVCGVRATGPGPRLHEALPRERLASVIFTSQTPRRPAKNARKPSTSSGAGWPTRVSGL